MTERFKLSEAAPIRPILFKEWREDRGWTQQELADKLGTTKQTVSRIETGARDWSKGYLEAFAHVVKCHPLAPLLISPQPGANELLGLLSSAGATDVLKAARSLRSLARASAPSPDPAAKAPLPPKQRETLQSDS